MAPPESRSSPAGSQQQQQQQPFAINWAAVSQRAMSLQFVWFVGYLALLLHALIYALATVASIVGLQNYLSVVLGAAPLLYQRALMSVLISYAIILYKKFAARFSLSLDFVQQVFVDSDGQYLMLAIVMITTSDSLLHLLIFAIPAVFHVNAYLSSHLLPLLVAPSTVQALRPWMDKISALQREAIERLVVLEIAVFPSSIIALLFGKGSLFFIIFFFQFLLLRYKTNPGTRTAFAALKLAVDSVLLHPNSPAIVQSTYNRLVGYISSMAESR